MVINVFVDIVSVESIKGLHKRKMSQNKLIRLTTTLYNTPYACVWWLTPLGSSTRSQSPCVALLGSLSIDSQSNPCPCLDWTQSQSREQELSHSCGDASAIQAIATHRPCETAFCALLLIHHSCQSKLLSQSTSANYSFL